LLEPQGQDSVFFFINSNDKYRRD